MKNNNDTTEYRSVHKGGKFLPALCSVCGTLILLSVIALCIPITAPKLMGYEIYNIVSGSMEPEIPIGSAIYVKAVPPEEVKEGDVIAFMRGSVQGEFLSDGGSYGGSTGSGSYVGDNQDGSSSEGGTYVGGAGDGLYPESDGTGSFFADGNVVVAHRVVMNQIVEGWFETKGDANEAADLSKIPYDALIGIVTYHIPMLGSLTALLTTTIGKLYMVCFAACGAMLNILAGRMREKSRGDLQRELVEELKNSKGAFRMTDEK